MVITDVNKVIYNGDGVVTAWPYTFRIINRTDIRLMLIDTDGTSHDIESDYYVDMVNSTVYYPGYAAGSEPPEEDQPPKVQPGQKIVVYRKLPINQLADLGDKWPFALIELGLDKLTMILQDIWDWLGRCLSVSLDDSINAGDDFDPTVPLAADKVVCGNADGTGFVAREALMEVNGAWDGEGRQIRGVADPTDNQDAATKKYVDNYADGQFMKLQPDGTAWEARNLPISNVTGPALVKDAANKDYVDRILAGYSGYGERLAIFDNVAQMRAAELIPSQMAVTTGYWDVNDGGAGVYALRDRSAHSEQTDSTTAYSKNVPTGAKFAKLVKLGGRSFVMNQMVQNGDFADTSGWSCDYGTLSASDSVLEYSITTASNGAAIRRTVSGIVAVHKYYVSAEIKCDDTLSDGNVLYAVGDTVIASQDVTELDTWTKIQGVAEISTVGNSYVEIYPRTNGWTVGDTFNVRRMMCIDLTVAFGAGNEPTLDEAKAIFSYPYGYYDYETGSLVNCGAIMVKSVNTNKTPVSVYAVPAAVQALTGYGYGFADVYNYIDFANKKFVQNVASRAYASGDESDSSVMTDGTTTLYVLTTPVETDISTYIDDVETVQTENGGEVWFVSQSSYSMPLPSEEIFLIGDVENGGSVIVLDNGIVAELITDGTVNVKQFGAVGNGVTDDTKAIQTAINYGRYVYFPYGKYLLNSSVRICNKWDHYASRGFVFDGKAAEFIYTGNEYAFVLQAVENAYFDFGVVKSANGGNIELYTTNNYDYIQYVEIHFQLLIANASSTNVYSHRSNTIPAPGTMHGWINEIRWYGGRFKGPAKYNFHIAKGSNCWLFQHIGFESNYASTKSVYLDATDGVIGQFVFYYCRHEETMDKFIESVGSVTKVYIYDYITFDYYRVTVSADSDNWTVYTGSDVPSKYVKGIGWVLNNLSKTVWGGFNVSSVDLDTLTKPGEYVFTTYDYIHGSANRPVDEAGSLTVLNLANYRDLSQSQILQMYTTRSGKLYVRRIGERWKSLKKNSYKLISEAVDFDTLVEEEGYSFENATVVSGSTNAPTGAGGGLLYVENLVYSTEPISNRILQKYVAYDARIFVRSCNGAYTNPAAWGAWKEITTA